MSIIKPNQKGEIVTILTVGTVIILSAVTLVSSIFLPKNKQTIKSRAADNISCSVTQRCTTDPYNTDPAKNIRQSCNSLNKCDICGGCNPACCKDNSDCPNGQQCTVTGSGYCQSTKSCDANSGTPITTPTPPSGDPCKIKGGNYYTECCAAGYERHVCQVGGLFFCDDGSGKFETTCDTGASVGGNPGGWSCRFPKTGCGGSTKPPTPTQRPTSPAGAAAPTAPGGVAPSATPGPTKTPCEEKSGECLSQQYINMGECLFPNPVKGMGCSGQTPYCCYSEGGQTTAVDTTKVCDYEIVKVPSNGKKCLDNTIDPTTSSNKITSELPSKFLLFTCEDSQKDAIFTSDLGCNTAGDDFVKISVAAPAAAAVADGTTPKTCDFSTNTNYSTVTQDKLITNEAYGKNVAPGKTICAKTSDNKIAIFSCSQNIEKLTQYCGGNDVLGDPKEWKCDNGNTSCIRLCNRVKKECDYSDNSNNRVVYYQDTSNNKLYTTNKCGETTEFDIKSCPSKPVVVYDATIPFDIEVTLENKDLAGFESKINQYIDSNSSIKNSYYTMINQHAAKQGCISRYSIDNITTITTICEHDSAYNGEKCDLHPSVRSEITKQNSTVKVPINNLSSKHQNSHFFDKHEMTIFLKPTCTNGIIINPVNGIDLVLPFEVAKVESQFNPKIVRSLRDEDKLWVYGKKVLNIKYSL